MSGKWGLLEGALQRIARIRKVTPEMEERAYTAVENGVHPFWAASEATGLPMDYESRMARAAASGRTQRGFHSSRDSFEAFDQNRGSDRLKMIHAGDTPDQGDMRLGYPVVDDEFGSYIGRKTEAELGSGGDNTIPLLMRARRPQFIRDQDTWDPVRVSSELESMGVFAPSREALQGVGDLGKTKLLQDALRRGGKDSFRYPNSVEGLGASIDDFAEVPLKEGANATAVFSPDDVRSVHAAFDPANEGTGYLLGSHPVAGTVAGALALWQMLKDKLSPPSQ